MAELLEAPWLAGLLLAGSLVLLVLLVGPTAFVPPAIWNGSEDVALRLISDHSRIWRVANLGFALATITTAAGLFLTPGVLGDRGSALAWVAAAVFVLAAAPWLLALAIRVAITPGVAARFVVDGTVDPAFVPLARLSGALFGAFILISSASIVALGAAVVTGGSLWEPLGWACLAAGWAIGGSYLAIGDTLPAFVYIPTAAVGTAVLLSQG